MLNTKHWYAWSTAKMAEDDEREISKPRPIAKALKNNLTE
jgi:hypothetical protein